MGSSDGKFANNVRDFATPADSPRRDGTPYRGLRARRWGWDLSVFQGPFSVAPRQTLTKVTIRDFFIAVWAHAPLTRPHCRACTVECGRRHPYRLWRGLTWVWPEPRSLRHLERTVSAEAASQQRMPSRPFSAVTDGSLRVSPPPPHGRQGWMDVETQIKTVEAVHALGRGPGGFYIPSYGSDARLSLHMMCLGHHWEPTTGAYHPVRPHDGARRSEWPLGLSRRGSERVKSTSPRGPIGN